MRDLYSNIAAFQALAPAVQAAAAQGPAIDLLGAGRVAFVVNTGEVAGSGSRGRAADLERLPAHLRNAHLSRGWSEPDTAFGDRGLVPTDAPAAGAAPCRCPAGDGPGMARCRLCVRQAP